MAQSNKTGLESSAEILELTRSRQLFLLDPFTKKLKIQHDITHWEEVVCAGYNPYYQRLEAVVNIKQPDGYNGGLCSNGSQEYIRFFIDFRDGAGFQDMGYTQFKVANIADNPPGPQHPLSYAAFLFIDDRKHRRFLDCDHAVVPLLRAVLSWNAIPSGNPNQHPHYGNHLDATIQLARRPWIIWKEVVELTKMKEVAKLVDENVEIKLKEPVAEKAETIVKINKEAGVPVHRTFYSTIGQKMNTVYDFGKAAGVFDLVSLGDLNFDLGSFYDFFNGAGKKADVSFEELTCVGLNTLTDRLSAVIHIKRPLGFSGNLCTPGSREHVAFWADWNNNGTWDQYLGTVSINVHDIANIPAGGLYYTVQMPMNTQDRLRLCSAPNIIRIRAVLSWESLPSTVNPNLLNHWGNFRDALVQLRPAFRPGTGLHSAIYLVGGVDRFAIDPLSHLYNAGPASANTNRPWGGLIKFTGIIDRGGFSGVVKYRFLWKPLGASDSAFQPVSTSETFSLDNIFDLSGPFPDPQTDPGGWYIYKQNPNIGLYNTDNYLAGWHAEAVADGPYVIQFVHTDEFGTAVNADQFTIIVCNKGMSVSPTANLVVDTAYDLDLVIDGGDCHSYTAGAPEINGHLRAVHPYFASWSLELQPTTHTHSVVPVPDSSTVAAIVSLGDGNAVWNLDTTALDPCGYTVSLTARSRVILNSSPGDLPLYGPKAVGFAKLP